MTEASELTALKARVQELEQTALHYQKLAEQYGTRLASCEQVIVSLTGNIAQLFESQNAILRVLNSEAA